MKLSHLLGDERGQGLTEYILLVSLIAIALIIVTKFFGNEIRLVFRKASDSLQDVVDWKGYNP
jgi:Flp pilus assembly pilin Flp